MQSQVKKPYKRKSFSPWETYSASHNTNPLFSPVWWENGKLFSIICVSSSAYRDPIWYKWSKTGLWLLQVFMSKLRNHSEEGDANHFLDWCYCTGGLSPPHVPWLPSPGEVTLTFALPFFIPFTIFFFFEAFQIIQIMSLKFLILYYQC